MIKYSYKAIDKDTQTILAHSTDRAYVLEMLSAALIAKFLNKAHYAKSIKRTQNYDGTITIVVNEEDDFGEMIKEFTVPG